MALQIENGDVALRPVTAADRGFLLRVYASTRTDELALVDWSEAEKRAFVEMQFSAQDQHYREHYPTASFDIVLLAGEPIGRLYVERWSDEIRVVDVTLLPDHRGGGVGTLLLRHLMQQASSSACRLTVHVERFNPALGLYTRLGFVGVAETGAHLLLEWRPIAFTDARSGENGLVPHALFVGPEGHQEQRELPEVGMTQREGLLLEETVVGDMEEQRERDASVNSPRDVGGGVPPNLARRQMQIERLAVDRGGHEDLPDERGEGRMREGLEHGPDAMRRDSPTKGALAEGLGLPSAGISRRGLVTAMGLGVALTAMPLGGGVLRSGATAFAGPNRSKKPLDLATVTADTFLPHVGTRFRLRRAGQPALDLTLSEVASRPPDGGDTESFSLLFRTAQPVELAQAVHELDHSSLGTFAMFMVPLGSTVIESIVNHVVM